MAVVFVGIALDGEDSIERGRGVYVELRCVGRKRTRRAVVERDRNLYKPLRVHRWDLSEYASRPEQETRDPLSVYGDNELPT